MEYFGGKLCISLGELVDDGVMSLSCYKALVHRGKIDVARRGCRGQKALVVVGSLPREYRAEVEARHPGGKDVLLRGWLMSHYVVDQCAVAWYGNRERTGLDLGEERVKEYVTNASVLNLCIGLYERARDCQKLFGGVYNWSMMMQAIEALRAELGHTLPGSALRFRKKVNEYQRHGYASLVSGKYGNQSARKVDYATERLILGLAVLPNKPWNKSVHEMYLMFVTGELDVYDPDTGELMNPDDYTDKDGGPKYLSESTINNVLNKPSNKTLVEHRLLSRTAFLHEQMPHMHRHGGEWSLSQVTMDDVDLTRQLKDTKQRVHAYYAYDVVSQCVIGASYSRKKDDGLVVECFRDMFRLIERMGWGMPAGIEVENHLMAQYKEGFLQAGVAFPFVRFCAPLNSQEKYAEAMNGAKKRSVIHKNHEGIGRFYGKGKWRREYKKVSEETNDVWEASSYYTMEELVADDRRDSLEWNHQLHPDQKRFAGMTRWEVLVGRVNPTLVPYDKCMLSRYVGVCVHTSIRRNSTVTVNGRKWWLSGPEVLEKLAPRNMQVEAYYLPSEEGEAEDVYLFQGDKYLCKVERVETYSRVMAEQTDEDKEKFVAQQKKVAKFGSWVKENAIQRLGVCAPSAPETDEEAPALVSPDAPVAQEEEQDEEWTIDYSARAWADL